MLATAAFGPIGVRDSDWVGELCSLCEFYEF